MHLFFVPFSFSLLKMLTVNYSSFLPLPFPSIPLLNSPLNGLSVSLWALTYFIRRMVLRGLPSFFNLAKTFFFSFSLSSSTGVEARAAPLTSLSLPQSFLPSLKLSSCSASLHHSPSLFSVFSRQERRFASQSLLLFFFSLSTSPPPPTPTTSFLCDLVFCFVFQSLLFAL